MEIIKFVTEIKSIGWRSINSYSEKHLVWYKNSTYIGATEKSLVAEHSTIDFDFVAFAQTSKKSSKIRAEKKNQGQIGSVG